MIGPTDVITWSILFGFPPDAQLSLYEWEELHQRVCESVFNNPFCYVAALAFWLVWCAPLVGLELSTQLSHCGVPQTCSSLISPCWKHLYLDPTLVTGHKSWAACLRFWGLISFLCIHHCNPWLESASLQPLAGNCYNCSIIHCTTAAPKRNVYHLLLSAAATAQFLALCIFDD